MKLAAIDIGSNSIHLVIVSAVEGQHMEIIDREKEMVRLGAGTLREHRLSKETIDRAITTLRRFKQMAVANRVELIIATATAAVRESHNAVEFIEQVRQEVGLDVQLLPGVEEARLIALAVSEVTDFNGRRALIIDIGGGSTEFIITSGGEPELLLSARLGAVRLTEKFITTDPISNEERERLTATIRSDLWRVMRDIKKVGFDFVIGTSGTVLNMLEAIVQSEAPHGAAAANGFEAFSQTVTLDQLRSMNRRLARLNSEERSRVPGLEKGRADIIIAGGLLLETILSELEAKEITSCDWSLREGVILNHLRKHTGARKSDEPPAGTTLNSSVEQSEAVTEIDNYPLDVRTKSVLSVARRYDYDAQHSHHVAKLALQIFDSTYDLHGMGEFERKLLYFATLLHDIGYHIAHNNHHRHGLYLIKNSEMPGFTASEIAIMAAIVRYHRGSMPDVTADPRLRREHEDFYALERSQRSTVLRLSAILQLADGLDRSHSQSVKDFRCDMNAARVTFFVEGKSNFDLELWSAERKAKMFEETFRVEVRFERTTPNPAYQQPGTVLVT